MWKLWLDDDVNNPDTPCRHCPEGFIGASSVVEAIGLVTDLGPPSFMDLDHDLGDNVADGMDFIKWLEMVYSDSPPDWNIHSRNVCEVENMDSFMRSWTKVVEATNEEDSE